MLQGPETTVDSVNAVRSAINEQRVETVEIINYRKDGTSFVNALQIGPILDNDGKLVFYFGSQLDVTEKRNAERKARKLADDELIHRLRNIVNVMSVVIRMTAREEGDAKALAAIVDERLRALSDAHFETIGGSEGQNLTFEKLAQTILAAYAPKGTQQFHLNGLDFVLPGHLLSCVALSLHELATNSVKHGSLGAEKGLINVGWEIRKTDDSSKFIFQWSETGGPKVFTPKRSSGSKLIQNLIAAANGSIELHWEETGLVVKAEFPL
ncbi:HWE histidine kinase domain-containing protein [Yoonia sp. MH D7]